jgi:hypothetical protein
MPLRFTPLMKKRLTRRAQIMLERSLSYFPELHGKAITVDSRTDAQTSGQRQH